MYLSYLAGRVVGAVLVALIFTAVPFTYGRLTKKPLTRYQLICIFVVSLIIVVVLNALSQSSH
jgi:hypothetical protein